MVADRHLHRAHRLDEKFKKGEKGKKEGDTAMVDWGQNKNDYSHPPANDSWQPENAQSANVT